MGLGHNRTEAQWDWDTKGLEHKSTGTQCGRDTAVLGHNWAGTQRGWDTTGLEYNGTGTQLGWYTTGMGHNGTGTQCNGTGTQRADPKCYTATSLFFGGYVSLSLVACQSLYFCLVVMQWPSSWASIYYTAKTNKHTNKKHCH